MSEETTPGNAEQAADLAALQQSAQEAPLPGAPGAPPPAQGAPAVDLAKEFAALISLAVSTAGPLFPSLPHIYTEDVTQAAAAAAASVCEKHGWMQDGFGGKYATEIAAAFVLGPLAVATYQGVKSDMAARRKPEPAGAIQLQAPGPVPGALAEPGSNTVSFGAPVAGAAA